MRGRRRPDRRVQRTRRRLHAALVELILERGWDRVAVQDVCDRAAIGRSTFYAHYADKEDLLIGGLDDVVDDLRVAAAAAPGPRRPFQFVAGLLAHAGASRRLFRAVIGKRSGLAVQRKFRAVLLELVDDELALLALREPDRAFAARFLAGALFELLVWWVDARPGVTAARLEHELLRLVEPVLRTAARPRAR